MREETLQIFVNPAIPTLGTHQSERVYIHQKICIKKLKTALSSKIFWDIGSHYVAQSGLELLASSNPPAWPPKVLGLQA